MKTRFEEGLYLHPQSRVYYTRFQHRGKIYNRSTRCTDKEAARAAAISIRSDVERLANGLPSLARSGATEPQKLIDKFITEKRRTEKTKGHVDTLGNRIGAFFVGVHALGDVTADHIRAVLERLRTESIKGRKGPTKRSPKTLNGYLGALGSFFRWLVKEQLWDRDPARSVDPLEVLDPVVDYRPFLPDERDAFLRVVPQCRLAAYVFTSATGLRRAEMRRLRVGDVVLDPSSGQEPHVRVRARVSKNKRARVLPLHPDVVLTLRPLLEGKAAEAAVFERLPTAETFANDVARAGLRRETPEGLLTMTSLRKALATDLDRCGAPSALRQKLMRHETAGLTNRVYTKYEMAELAGAVGKLALLPLERQDEYRYPLAVVPEAGEETADDADGKNPSDLITFSDGPSSPFPTAIDLTRPPAAVDHPPSHQADDGAKICPRRDERPPAGVAELADALDSGACALPRNPIRQSTMRRSR